MIESQFHQPARLRDVLALLTKYGASARLLAGGTDLIVEMMEGRIKRPENIISLTACRDIQYLTYAAKTGLRIGALATYTDVEESRVVKRRYPVLAEAARAVAARQIRNMGTIVANICHASPSAEMATPLLVLDASIVLAAAKGKPRTVPLVGFFTGPGKSVRKETELATEIVVPPPPANYRAIYYKLSPRKAMDIAVVGVSVLVATNRKGAVTHYRVALGAVAPTPIRVPEAEAVLVGQVPTEALMDAAAEAAFQAARPISDVRGSAEYRHAMVRVLVRRGTRHLLGFPEA